MAHAKLRNSNYCLNCNAVVPNRYCTNCGQLNTDPREHIGHLVRHFFEDITHFDGKFFSSVKFLLFRPGFLTKQYSLGKRQSYLNPVRMYIFTSFVFFFIFFATNADVSKQAEEVQGKEDIVRLNVNSLNDSVYTVVSKTLNNGAVVPRAQSAQKIEQLANAVKRKNMGLRDYLKKQDTAKVKDNVVERFFAKRAAVLDEKYNGNERLMMLDGLEKFIHTFPQFLFVSLPLVSLFLGLLYYRRKEFTLVDHGIFVIHFYIFIFIMLLIGMGLGSLHSKVPWGIFSILKNLLTLFSLYYLYRAMKVFYGQKAGKTLLKYFLFLLGISFVFLLLVVIFGLVTFLKL